MCCVCDCYKGGHNSDGYNLASTLCKYDLRQGDLFVLSWARVQRVRQGSISSELLMCGGGLHSIWLLPLEIHIFPYNSVTMKCLNTSEC